MNTKSSDFSKGSIPAAILRLAGPMTVAQLVNLLYSIVDRMYIGRLPETGRLALTGIGITFPIITILIAFANLCGVGGAPLFSIARGKGDSEEAEQIMGNTCSMLFLLGVLLTVSFLVFRKPVLYLFGADDTTFPFADQFLSVYLIGTVFVMISLGLNPFINAQGFARIGMMTVVGGAVINIALDPFFIFVLKLGVTGAAIANVLSQGFSALWVMHFLTGKKALLLLRRRYLRLKPRIVGRILSLGVSGFCMAITVSIVQILCNATLSRLGGDLYVSVMTVINSIRDLVTLPMMGFTNGSSPIMSYNYGAKEYGRVRQCIRFMSLLAGLSGVLAWLLVMLAPELLIRLFNSDADLIQAGIPAFRIYFSTIFLMAGQLAGQSVSLALGRAKQAIFFSLLRKAFIVAPLTILLPNLWNLGVNGVFWAEPISNVIGGLACYITMIIVIYIPLGRLEKSSRAVPVNT